MFFFNRSALGILKQMKIQSSSFHHWSCNLCLETTLLVSTLYERKTDSNDSRFVEQQRQKNSTNCKVTLRLAVPHPLLISLTSHPVGERYYRTPNTGVFLRMSTEEIATSTQDPRKCAPNNGETEYSHLSESSRVSSTLVNVKVFTSSSAMRVCVLEATG